MFSLTNAFWTVTRSYVLKFHKINVKQKIYRSNNFFGTQNIFFSKKKNCSEIFCVLRANYLSIYNSWCNLLGSRR